jgi:fluoride ion exporter CrcB/FEX
MRKNGGGITGALFFWVLHRFKNKLSEELSADNTRRNNIASLIIFIIIMIILYEKGIVSW